MVAEHSFQVPMPNSPLLLNYLCFGAHLLHESRLITNVFIRAFVLGCVLLPWQRDSLDCFHLLHIVEFRIPGYPGPSKEQGTEVRLMRGKIFRGKIRM